MLATSPMIRSAKRMEKKRKGISAVEVCIPFPRGESLCFILEFLLDYREDNLRIFAIKSLFPYQGLILLY